jgi:hypothetical protein
MNVPTIHCHSHSDKSTIEYAVFMWKTMRELANHPEALRMTAHCIGPTAADQLGKLPNSQGFHVPATDGGVGGQGGSTAHGVCVEHALAMTDDGDIHLNVDSDTVVLAKGWDDYIRIQLLDRGVGIMGATFEDIGGFSSGGGLLQTFKGIPYTCWMAMSPAHVWRDLKVRPAKDSNIPISNEGLAKTYGLPIGYSVLKDVGWQIPEYLHARNIPYVGWKHLKGSKDAVVLKGLSDYHEEFHVDGNVPFVVHHRGSMRHPYRAAGISLGFYTAVDNYITQEKKHEQPRWVWQANESNAAIRTAMQVMAREAAPRIAQFVASARSVTAPAAPAAPTPTMPVPTVAAIDGWLKATLDDRGVFSRYTQPVPRLVDITFTPDTPSKHLRLEGNVVGVHIQLPPAPLHPHWMTVRNLTAGPATLLVPDGRRGVDVPVGACWQVLVDVDGVIHVT